VHLLVHCIFRKYLRLLLPVFTQADGSRGDSVLLPCVYVFVFLHDFLEIDAARIMKVDVEMFHYEFRKHVFWGQKVKVTLWVSALL